jgi:hypothetical protein
MKVARQFIAWNALKKGPSRRVRYELVDWRVHRSSSQNVPSDSIIPFPNGTVRFSLHSQAVNCQATIISSLRDKNERCPFERSRPITNHCSPVSASPSSAATRSAWSLPIHERRGRRNWGLRNQAGKRPQGDQARAVTDKISPVHAGRR